LSGARRRAAPAGDLRLLQGAETRRRILARAFDLAGAEGLEALTIGRLADDLGMSKAGLFGHFGSKEALQLAVVEEARADFVARVGPALSAPEGLPRLESLCAAWLAWARGCPGGCFFSAAAAEFDGRGGPVRDRIAASVAEWMAALTSTVEDARRLGHLAPDTDAAQLAFELHALELGGNAAFQLFGDKSALERAERAIGTRIAAAAATPTAAGAARSARRKDPGARRRPE
jgi:AcrR family transcriptional regulator